MIAAYALLFSFLSLRKYLHYLYSDFDLAIFAQAVDRLRYGSTWSSIRGMDWRGDHSSLILYPIAPLTWAFPPAIALLVLQSVALALGAWPVHRLARRALGDERLALACVALYLLSPAVGYSNLFEFHPEVLCTAILLAALDAVMSGSTVPALCFAALSLLGKEDMALAVLGVAACSLLLARPGRWRLAAALAAMAAGSLAATFLWLRPHYGHGEVDYAQMYAAWGHSAGEMGLALLRHPLRALASLVSTPGNPVDSGGKLQFYLHLLLPLGGLPLLAPAALVGALPMLAQHMLSSRATQHSIAYHYTAALTPFLMLAAVMGLARLRSLRDGLAKARLAAASALALSLVSNLLFGPVLGHRVFQAYPATEPLDADDKSRTLQQARDRMIARVPVRDGVVASFEFLGRLAARENVQSFHHVYLGHYTLSPKPYPMPRDVHAMLSAVGNQWDEGGARRVRELLAQNDLHPVDAADDLVLYLRGARDTISLLDPRGMAPGDSTRVVYDGQLAFVGCDLPAPRVTRGEPLVIRTDWCRVAPADRVFLTLWSLMDEADKVALYRTRYLGYGIATADLWPIGETLRETYRLVIPPALAPGRYRLVMEVAMRKGGSGGMARPDDPRLATAGGMLQLGFIEVGEATARR